MELCKTDTNMSLEMNGGLSQVGGGEAAAAGPLGHQPLEVVLPPSASQVLPSVASNGHLKCTCLPSITPSEMEENKIVEAAEASIALAEVSTASSHNSKVHFNDEIEVVQEDEEDEDMIDLAQALYAAGVRPELLASISEENIFHEAHEDGLILSDEDLGSPLKNHEELRLMWSQYEAEEEDENNGGQGGRLTASLSEPDLLSCKLPHPSSRPLKNQATSFV